MYFIYTYIYIFIYIYTFFLFLKSFSGPAIHQPSVTTAHAVTTLHTVQALFATFLVKTVGFDLSFQRFLLKTDLM